MRTDEFWAVVDRARAGGPAMPATVADRAVDDLAKQSPEEILAWGRHFDKVLAASEREDLFAAAYLINGGLSADGFDSFRAWLVAHGRDAFASAAGEPDSLADLPGVRAAADSGAVVDAEEMLSIARRAYLAATGEEPPGHDERPPLDTGRFWDFDDDEQMHRRLPRLAALFLAPPAGADGNGFATCDQG